MDGNGKKLVTTLAPALCLLVLIAGLGLAQASSAERSRVPECQPHTLPATFYPVADATTSQANSKYPYGDELTLECGLSKSGYAFAYLAFDLSSIPPEATVVSATLELYLEQLSGTSQRFVAAYSITAAWEEDEITWETQPDPDTLEASASFRGMAGYKTWDVTGLAQAWVSGSQPNHGLVLVPQGSENFSAIFTSREAVEDWPRLLIEYETPTPTPTVTCPDPYEPNDTFETAWPISPGSHQSYICGAGDMDYFQFSARLADTIQLLLTDLPQNYDLALLDPFSQERARSEEGGTDDEYIEWYVDSQIGDYTQYRVVVFGHGDDHDAGAPYTLQLTVVTGETPTPTPTSTPPSCAYDPWEPNDVFSEAAAISLGVLIQAGICPPADEDYYRFYVPENHTIGLQLGSLPADYDVCLWGPDGLLYPHPVGACSRNLGTAPEAVSARANVSGEYRAQVFGKMLSWDEGDRYDLLVTVSSPTPTRTPTVTRTPTSTPTPTRTPLPPPQVDLALTIDDASRGVTVRKLRPDVGGLADRTWVDVVVEASSASHIWPLDIVLVVPPEFGDPVGVWRRDCTWGSLEDHSATMTRLDAGRYQVRLSLYRTDTFGEYRHQLVFRFGLTPTVTTGSHQPYAYTTATSQHGAATSNWGSVYVVDWTPALIVTNRQCLFDANYDDEAVVRLLHAVFDQAAGSPWGCVYYADRYSETVYNWRPGGISYWSTANVAADVVDDLIEDWADDSSSRPSYLLIVGDDPIIPYYRVNDPTNAESGSEYHGVHYILDELTQHDGFFSDAKYADLDDSNWKHRPCDLAVGRIVGFSPDDMITFMLSGQTGPDVSNRHFVGASWAGMNFDHEYNLHDPLRDYGFNILYDGTGEPWDIIDNWNEWERADLVRAMQQGFGVMGYCGHGDHNWITTPEEDEHGNRLGISASDIHDISVNGAHLDANHPIFAFVACRVGYSLSWSASRSMVYTLAREGASAVMASAGISWFRDTFGGVEYDAWSEVLGQLFWLKLLDPRWGKSVGGALQGARWTYDEGVYWDDEDEKTIMEFTLFGLPWVTLPHVSGTRTTVERAASPEPPMSPVFGQPRAVATEDDYSLHAVVDASSYVVDHSTIPGFDLLKVEGMRQSGDAGKPVVPFTTLTLTLPSDASITGVAVVPSNDTIIDNLNIPMVVPGIPMEGAPQGGFVEVPFDAGIYPAQPYTYHVSAAGDRQQVALYLVPAAYDPGADRAVLHRTLDVTVNYRASHSIILADVHPTGAVIPADQLVIGHAVASNVADTPITITPIMRLIDDTGSLAGAWAGAAVVVPAGGSASVTVSSGGPLPVGAYLMELVAEQEGVPVAQGDAHLSVTGGELGLEGPTTVRPGAIGTFEATWENFLARSAQVTITLEILNERGQVIATEVSDTRAVGAGNESTFYLFWISDPQQSGRLVARVWADVDGHRYGPRSRPVDVPRPVLLPLIMRPYE